MSSRTWIYVIILIIVLAAGGVFFWWMYKTSKISPKAAPTPTPTPQTFSDVDPSYWAYTEIEAVNKAGYMTGYHEFRPDQNATRADAAAVLGRAYSKSYDNPTPSFSDVPATYWAYQYIEGLKQAGMLDGYPDGTFRPDQPATRSDLAILLAGVVAGGKANVPDPGNVNSPFSDVATTDPAFKYIYYCHQNGTLTGYPDGTFKPDQVSTRADLAVGVARAKAGSDAAVPTPTTTSFTDVPATYWAYKYIEYVNSIQAMTGYPPVFKPDDFADRASVAVVIARAVAGSESAVPAGPATPSYSDVPTDYWAYKHIEYLKTQNIMTGFSDGTFRPTEIAQRFTMAVVLARAKGLTLDPAPPTATFADVATDAVYYKEVEAIYKAGYTNGCGTDAATGKLNFCPTSNLSRAALAVFTYNAYIKLPLTGSPSPQPSTPVPSPSSPTATPTPTQTQTQVTTGTGGTTGTTTTTARTGPEIPLLGGGLLSALLLARFLVNRKLK